MPSREPLETGVAREFEAFYREWYPYALTAAEAVAGSDAPDVVADAFTKAYSQWSRLATMESPSAWVMRVAINGAKRRERRRAMEGRFQRLLLRPRATPSLSTAAVELRDALVVLSERQRLVVLLRLGLDLPEKEVASMLGIRRGTVAATLSQARARLREELTRGEADIEQS